MGWMMYEEGWSFQGTRHNKKQHLYSRSFFFGNRWKNAKQLIIQYSVHQNAVERFGTRGGQICMDLQ